MFFVLWLPLLVDLLDLRLRLAASNNTNIDVRDILFERWDGLINLFQDFLVVFL